VEDFGLPSGRITGASYDSKTQVVSLSLDSTIFPEAKYKLHLKTGKAEVTQKSNVAFDPARFSVERTHYKSKDGTRIPMWIVKSKEAPKGPGPTWLYGYGGFAVDVADGGFLRKEFIPFLEAGGTVALPVLRGGSELGDPWHLQGNRGNKQRVFDDFIGAAEFLRSSGTASSLAISGGSNGGLLTGATTTQRPDLFDAVIDHAGVNDMLRFDEFSGGNWWVSEYGNPEDPKDAATLLEYSPLHHPKSGKYPPMLISTGQYDARVDPAHSYKFAAEMQHYERPSAPVFLYAHPHSAHGMDPRPREMAHQLALIYGGFLMGELKMRAPKAHT
jgi:prolyl oligopeptidase